jgi:membrane-bound lytic murein transglycosylase D
MKSLSVALCTFLAAVNPAVEERASAARPAPVQTEGSPAQADLYSLGQDLFEALVPADVRGQYEFLSREEWDRLGEALQRALTGGSLDDLAELRPTAELALSWARGHPDAAELVDWLERTLDLSEAADLAVHPPPPPPEPQRPQPPPAREPVPHYDLWKRRLSSRPVPPRAAEFLPALREIFRQEGIPVALVWVAEVESAFNPAARSPAGAKGLFQLMPATAGELGLRTFMPDERAHPERSARAAARLLRTLHRRFSDWPLALAAYNAGEGRVRRTLAARRARTFTGISAALPVETQLYVPKVLATLSLREGVDPSLLPPPSPRAAP